MLKTLYISNYALIDRLQVDFDAGLTIITGETGAGKSIIMGALALLLGERASSQAIRDKLSKTVVEATCHLQGPRSVHYLSRLTSTMPTSASCVAS